MHNNTLLKVVLLLAIGSLLLAGCGGAKSGTEAVNLNDYSLDEIVKGAKDEGHVESVGMPDSWANWGETWQELTATYGITHADTDMSSAEELNMFENEKDAPTKDIGDIGLGFTADAIEKGLVQGYKTSYWDAVPDWAKAEDGKWMIAYTGVTTFIFNGASLMNQPQLHGLMFGMAPIKLPSAMSSAVLPDKPMSWLLLTLSVVIWIIWIRRSSSGQRWLKLGVSTRVTFFCKGSRLVKFS